MLVHMAKLLAASAINVADNYQLYGIGPKNQLIGNNVAAYAPWKWAVSKKLRIDAIIYPNKIDQIKYAFSQLMQPIFQQLDA